VTLSGREVRARSQTVLPRTSRVADRETGQSAPSRSGVPPLHRGPPPRPPLSLPRTRLHRGKHGLAIAVAAHDTKMVSRGPRPFSSCLRFPRSDRRRTSRHPCVLFASRRSFMNRRCRRYFSRPQGVTSQASSLSGGVGSGSPRNSFSRLAPPTGKRRRGSRRSYAGREPRSSITEGAPPTE
jgi:hypothetical protein